MATFNVQGKVVDKTTKLGVPFAQVTVYEVDSTPTGYRSDFLVDGTTDLNGNFNIPFTWSLDITILQNRPDIIFKVIQKIDGIDKVIYNENPATKTRWNIGDILSVTLEAENCVGIVPPISGRPYDVLFVFTRVGVIGVNTIDTVGAGASGYAYPDTDPAAPNSIAANTPFGSTLDIAGWFGQFTDAIRYKIQYSSDGVTFHDIADPLYNYYYEFAPTGGSWKTMPMGPFSEGGQNNVFKLPYVERPGQPWIYPDLIAKWDTTKVVDGVYTLRIQGYRWNAAGTALVPSVALLIDPSYGVLRLITDNTPPVAKITGMKHNTTDIKVCDIVKFTSGTLHFSIEASDGKGHLREYVLNAMYGHNQVVTPVPSGGADTYANHVGPSRHWNGGTFTVDYDAATYTSAKMPKCAYQFRLDVTKRTTNGYGLIYVGVEDTMHITLDR
jgi:hypothetical protein